MNPIELGKFIASLRNEKNLTQEELAEKLFIDKRKISRWECGTSIPEFDMLIKLSEILDVSLYELSIAKRIENDILTKKVINKFKSIKDFKKYKLKKKIKIIILIIFFIIFLITSTYTIKYNDTVEIYKLKSIDDKYYLNGDYIRAKDYTFFYIKEISLTAETKENNLVMFKDCEYEIYEKNKRIIHINNDEQQPKPYLHTPYYENNKNKKLNNNVNLQVTCNKNNIINSYSINIELSKIYNNKLF